jgi:hypothetical protein
MNTNVFETLRLIQAKWKLVALSICLFAGLAVMAGLRTKDSVKSTITVEMAPGNYASMVEHVTGQAKIDTRARFEKRELTDDLSSGGKSSDPLLDPLNQFSMLLFLLQDQVSAAEYLSKGAQAASSDQISRFLGGFVVVADRKIPGRATVVTSGKVGDDRDDILKAWLAFNQKKVMTKVREVLNRTLDEYAATIETQMAGVSITGKLARRQKIAELEVSLVQLSAARAPTGIVLEPVLGAGAFDPSGVPGGGVEVTAAVTPQGLRNQITLLKNLTPFADELDYLDTRRQIASLFRSHAFDVPVFRMMGTSTQPSRFSFALPIWMALGAALGSALALSGLILISQSRRLMREMKLAERRSVDLVRRALNDEVLSHRGIRMEAAE